jgi:hypothetical protein
MEYTLAMGVTVSKFLNSFLNIFYASISKPESWAMSWNIATTSGMKPGPV